MRPIDLELGRRRARAAITLTAALPGALYLFQGEELGLEEYLDMPAEAREDPLFIRTNGQEIGRDGCRVPLPWTTRSVDLVRILATRNRSAVAAAAERLGRAFSRA